MTRSSTQNKWRLFAREWKRFLSWFCSHYTPFSNATVTIISKWNYDFPHTVYWFWIGLLLTVTDVIIIDNLWGSHLQFRVEVRCISSVSRQLMLLNSVYWPISQLTREIQLTLTLEMNTATKTVLRTTPTHTIIFHLLKTRRLVSNHSLCHDYCLNESMLNLGCLKQPFLKRLIFLQRLEIP